VYQPLLFLQLRVANESTKIFVKLWAPLLYNINKSVLITET
jgi:hypothetical protein